MKTHYTQKPNKMEIINIDDKDLIYVRENIEEETISTEGSETTGYIADGDVWIGTVKAS